MKKKELSLILGMAFSAALTFGGCANAAPMVSGEHPNVELSTWVSYWDSKDGLYEYDKIKDRLVSVAAFSASYDPDDKLVLPMDTEKIIKSINKDSEDTYLSVVNDVWVGENSNKNAEKSEELMVRLLKNEEKRQNTAQEMIDTAKKYNLKGIELDYENFWSDSKSARRYVEFLPVLYDLCQQNDLKLRVVLEPLKTDFDAEFPEGPEYVIMVYNLYGIHSGPGPKANRSLIDRVMKNYEKLPGKKGLAFATGGCQWKDYGLLGFIKGEGKFIDQSEAEFLARKYFAKVERDSDSAALNFTYTENDSIYAVWYADTETINAWITEVANRGVTNISIWRLGHNVGIENIK